MAWQHCSFEERFSASYTVNTKTGCWEWAKTNVEGYGGIDYGGKTVVAHRAAWLRWKGEIPDGLFVLHKCDNKRCVNYKQHLYLGTKKDNRRDFMQRHPRAKIIMMEANKKCAKAVKKFWDKMTPAERKCFCKMRSAIQLEKAGGKWPRTGTKGTRRWITN